ncbi:MAG TPA: signal peptide peptidase SppA, partial [Flavipsychrobacter sp.]|nr:signal peptide peptidase SppA [Flavipsychrobacter sp.]
MKQFFKMFFASFLAMIVMSVIVFGLTVGLIAALASDAGEDGKEVAANSVLRIEMSKVIHEIGETNPFAAFGGLAYSPGLYDIIKAIETAKTDKNVKGIFIKMDMTPNGWATLQQLRQALVAFKASKKFIYAYGEVAPQKSYYLASVADSIFLNPVGFTELNGLSSELPFFKGTLQKLEIEPEIFYAGKFKSATEPFREEKMSEPNRKQISDLQEDIWTEFTTAVASHSKVSAATVDGWAQTGAIQFPEDALRNKLIDGLAYIDQVEDIIRLKLDKKKDDKKKDDEKINYVELDEYTSTVKRKRKMKDGRIAVLLAEGSITDGQKNEDFEIASEDFVAQIRKIRKNDKIKAVVLRVNSPGGSALASEVILRELQLLRAKKPIIVSMGDVAASGGYYIACQADSIFALPNTITGSIGVFTMLFNAEKMLQNKLGITFDEVKNAPYADFPTVTRALTAEEGRRMQAMVDTIYQTFMRRVATARRMETAMVDSIAQGRVWSGTDAL